MFFTEKPIEKKDEDRLGRLNFSDNLAKAILDWNATDSLVLALNGKWGSGKSSVINLAKDKLLQSEKEIRPTIIEFNPWLFSGEEKLNEHFFNEISKGLAIKNSSTNDIKIANKLRLYSQLISLVPNQSQLSTVIKDVLVIMAILGLSAQSFLRFFNIHIWTNNTAIFCISISLLILSLINSLLRKFADVFDKRSLANAKTVLSFKEELKKALEKRGNKILIIVDDIDRLTPEEIRILFKLIKINSDFPNVMYLLSFDRDVVKAALEVQDGIEGQDYLEKIVQVTFDIPLANQERISKILIEECNLILGKLPKSSELLFKESYWDMIYRSGLKNLFRNIRDVKRFANSLEFNLSFLFKEDSMEVNPIDFIAIEGIRIFAPDFYSFMRSKKSLFTYSREDGKEIEQSRRKEIEDELNKLNEPLKNNVKGLISKLFPQVGTLLKIDQNLIFSNHYSSIEASKSLKVCSPNFFDAYFTLIPGGDESELSQFEIDFFLSSLTSKQSAEIELKNIIERKKISQLLERLENYTTDSVKIPDNAVPNFVQIFFDISDNLPAETTGLWGLKISTQFERVIIQLFGRCKNKQDNFNILKEAIPVSKGLLGPIEFIFILSGKDEKFDLEAYLPENTLIELQNACVKKIEEEAKKGTLMAYKNADNILMRWKEWGNNKDWEIYFMENIKEDVGLLNTLKSFIGLMKAFSNQGSIQYDYFNYESLDCFVSSDDIKVRLEGIRNQGGVIYQGHKTLVDLFLNDFRKDPRRY